MWALLQSNQQLEPALGGPDTHYDISVTDSETSTNCTNPETQALGCFLLYGVL